MIPGLYLRGRIYWFRYSVDAKQRFESLRTDNLTKAIALANDRKDKPPSKGGKWAVEAKAYVKSAVASGHLSANFGPNRLGVLLAEAERMEWKHPDDLGTGELQKWFDTLRRSRCDSTALTYLTHVRSFLGSLVDAGKLRENPCDGIDLHHAKYALRSNIATAKQARKLIDSCKRQDLKLALMLGFLCGLRRREIMHARWEWIEGKILRVRKGKGFTPKWGKERLVPIPRALVAAINPKIAHRLTYIVGPGRNPWDFKRPWLDHLTACGIKGLTIHDMRRTFASLKVSAGVPLYKVSKWLGISLTVAERNYAHLAPDTSGDVERGLP